MRDLTIEEIEMVNGGDVWAEIQQAIGAAWSGFWNWVQQNNPVNPPTPTQQTVDQIKALCGSNPQSVTFTNGGVSGSINAGTKTGTVSVQGGSLTVVCH